MTAEENIQAHVERILQREAQREARNLERREEVGAARGAIALAAAVPEPSSRVLVAEGDSWFDYPGTDVLEELEDVFGYEVESVAHHGDTLESMAYGERQLDRLNRTLAKLAQKGRSPRAILLSAGGNDIAGDEFSSLLNHVGSGLDPINEYVLRGLVDERLSTAMKALISKIGLFCQRHFDRPDIPVLIHGYDYPIPDGRGFLGGWWILPGPWLRPGFLLKGYGDLGENTRTMMRLIDRFNAMLSDVAHSPGFQHVRYVDLRRTLSHELIDKRYRDSWDNELHPEDEGFAKVAQRFHGVLSDLP